MKSRKLKEIKKYFCLISLLRVLLNAIRFSGPHQNGKRQNQFHKNKANHLDLSPPRGLENKRKITADSIPILMAAEVKIMAYS